MKKFRLADMKGGWFIGDFFPTCLKTDKFEVACKYYKKDDKEKKHVHKIATEITLIAKGLIKMNGITYSAGDIIFLDPGDASDFQVLEDTMTVAVKVPSVIGDKHLV